MLRAKSFILDSVHVTSLLLYPKHPMVLGIRMSQVPWTPSMLRTKVTSVVLYPKHPTVLGIPMLRVPWTPSTLRIKVTSLVLYPKHPMVLGKRMLRVPWTPSIFQVEFLILGDLHLCHSSRCSRQRPTGAPTKKARRAELAGPLRPLMTTSVVMDNVCQYSNIQVSTAVAKVSVAHMHLACTYVPQIHRRKKQFEIF